jgi:hypothetical protein
MKKTLKVFLVGSFVLAMVLATGTIAMAAPDVVDGSGGTAFLCPSVGNETAANANGWFGGPLPQDPDSYTFLPGHNQSGAHANYHGWNAQGPGDSPGPGKGNTDWSPIWPPAD